jgi:hypothetical protein
MASPARPAGVTCVGAALGALAFGRSKLVRWSPRSGLHPASGVAGPGAGSTRRLAGFRQAAALQQGAVAEPGRGRFFRWPCTAASLSLSSTVYGPPPWSAKLYRYTSIPALFMTSYTANSFVDYHHHVQDLANPGTFFRGHKDGTGYKLMPSVGRYLRRYTAAGLTKDNLLSSERDALEVFELVMYTPSGLAARERLADPGARAAS